MGKACYKAISTDFPSSECHGEGLCQYKSFPIFSVGSQLFGKGLRASPALLRHFHDSFILQFSCLSAFPDTRYDSTASTGALTETSSSLVHRPHLQGCYGVASLLLPNCWARGSAVRHLRAKWTSFSLLRGATTYLRWPVASVLLFLNVCWFYFG